MKRFALWGFLVAFLVQAAFLAWMIIDRALLLANGQEIRLPVVPIDPRDLLRGDYVILSYDISRLDAGKLGGDDEFFFADPIYVAGESGPEGWKATSIHKAPPESGIFLVGYVEDVRDAGGSCGSVPCMEYGVVYNLEQFFVPEGEGIALEGLRNDQRMSVDVAVASSGRAALKRLLVDGEVRYSESLW